MARGASKPRLSLETAERASLRERGRCAACSEFPAWANLALQWHHIFPQTKYPDLVDEEDNIVAVCERCHTRHTNAVERLPRRLCKRAERFANDRMLAFLDRTYGPKETA